MSNFNMHSIKRAARKEAWYSDSYNPFRKVRSNTWNPPKPRDEESDGVYLSNVQTEPIAESPYRSTFGDDGNAIRRGSKPEEAEMTKPPGAHEGRSSEPESEATIVGKESTNATSETEPRQRKKYLPGFMQKGSSVTPEGEEKIEKKRPWYKGKVLYHSQPFTLRNQLGATIFNSYINLLLIAAPVGIALNYAHINGKVIFVVNFIAIIPLAAMLSFATEEIALHVGESLGGLLNATFGNAVELIVAVIALVKGEVVVVQTSLIGSILSNLLLVMGMCFFFGGLRRKEQFFNQTVAQTAASLLALAIGSIIIPTCFDQFSSTTAKPIAELSRGTAVILLVVYIAYLYFQLNTHSDMFNEESKKVAMRPRKHAVPQGSAMKALAKAGGIGASVGRAEMSDRPPNDELIQPDAYERADEQPEEPQLHILTAWLTLAGATALIGLCAEFMVDGISSITDDGVSIEFVGLILLPIVGNAAEHATAVTVACKDKMDLAIGVAVGSSMQVALLLIPLMVIIGWILGNDCMTLDFDGFQVAVLFVAVLLVNYLIGDGKSHWLEGMLLQCLYLIIAVCAWYYPQTDPRCYTAGDSSTPLNATGTTTSMSSTPTPTAR